MSPSLPPSAVIAAGAAGLMWPTTGPVAAMARIRARSDGQPVLWWWQGELFGKRPGEIARPLMQIRGIGFNRVHRLPDGLWESRMSEAGYYIDGASGAVLATWRNPYTGQTVTPQHNRLRLRYLIDDDGTIRPSFPGVPFEGRVASPLESGDSVWVSEQLAAQFPQANPNAPAGSPKGLAGAPMEKTHFCASLADVRNPELAVVPATMSHSTLWSFYPWMGLDPESGYVLTEIVGRKLGGIDEIPAPLRERIEADHPGFLAHPDV